jgi:hypothetical protein
VLLSAQQLEAAKAAALAAMPKFVGGRPGSAPAAATAPAVGRAAPAARSSIPSPSAAVAGSYARGERQVAAVRSGSCSAGRRQVPVLFLARGGGRVASWCLPAALLLNSHRCAADAWLH